MKKLIIRALLVIVAMTCLVQVFMWTRWTGFMRSGVPQIMDAGPRETLNLMRCLYYWSTYLGKLEYQSDSGMWAFPAQSNSRNLFERGVHAYHAGDFDTAVAAFEEDLQQQKGNDNLRFWLGMSYLRRAEQENCLDEITGDPSLQQQMCTYPVQTPHGRQKDALRAAQLFQGLAAQSKTASLERWLAYYSYQTADREAPETLKPAGSFQAKLSVQSDRAMPLFEDRAQEMGLAVYDAGKGVAVEDYNGDGLLDIVTGGSFDPLRLLINRGDRFEDRTAQSDLADVVQPHIISNIDLNNDGHMDLFVGSLFQPDRLFLNRGNGTFDDVTQAWGLALKEGTQSMTWCPAWADIDGDGDLDLFVSRWDMRWPLMSGYLAEKRIPSMLYLNQGNHFEEVTNAWGLADHLRDNAFIGASFGDVDGDGDPDLFVSSIIKRYSRLWRNTGTGFEPAGDFPAGFTAAFLDVDHDGDLDLFHGGLADARTTTAKAVYAEDFGYHRAGKSVIMFNDGTGAFTAKNDFFNLPISIMGGSFGDVNNDGYHDFYLGTGGPESWFVLPNMMYLGIDGQSTRNLTGANGFGSVQKGHGIVFFDVDNDGDQDIYSSLGGMWPGDRWYNQMFINQSPDPGQWVSFRLQDPTANRHGVGAQIRVHLIENGKAVTRYAAMDQKTAFGAAPYLIHMGLGNAETLEKCQVRWPNQTQWETFHLEMNQHHILVRGQGKQQAPIPAGAH